MATAQMPGPRSARLSDDAATAALYAVQPRRKASVRETTVTSSNQGAVGGASNLSAASAGAALAHANRKPVEIWRPGRQPAAETAAYRVKDFTPPQFPQPKPSTQYSAEGLGAAILAVREQRNSSLSPTRTAQKQEHSRHLQNKARQAATGAYATGRRRSDSAPSEPTVAGDSAYALKAAGTSHRLKREEEQDEGPLSHLDSAMEASRIRHITNTNAKLYTSAPPVASEVEERNRQNSLRAAAISMAKDMYDVTEAKNNTGNRDSALQAAQRGSDRSQSRKTISGVEGTTAQRAMTLQEAAQKRAAEKLALMKNDHAELQNYYGTAPQPPRSRLTTRRKRTSSDADVTQVDAEQSRRIRNQMFSLRSKLNQVDEKRTKDRELLMLAAQRNVNATMQGMDKKMYADTGRAPPSLQREWDDAAHERARREAEAVEAASAHGNRINIGGNQYMDMADVEAVARNRLQPTLDEISDNAEQRRAQELEARLDAEEQQRRAAIEREREASLSRLTEGQNKGGADKEKRHSKGMSFLLWRTKSKLSRQGRPTSREGGATGAQEATAEVKSHEQALVVQDEAAPEVTAPEVATEEPVAIGAGPALNEESEEEPKAEPEPASVETPEASEAAAPAAPATMVTAAHIGAPVTITEPIEFSGRPGMVGRSLTTPRDAAAVGGSIAPMHVIRPITSPRADSKLKTWFRDRLVRRSSGPVRVYPHQPGPEYNRSESSIGFSGGAALTGRPESRGAALGSHPVSGDDLDQSEPARNGSLDVNKTKSTSDDSNGSFEFETNGNRKSKRMSFRKTFLRSPSRTDEPKTNGASHGFFSRNSDVPETKVHGTDLTNLRESATDQGLPVPPILGESTSTGRESRFSEDLS
ncbi:hypothetical protein N7478_013377 [Penicillium angulare]|uniref:uncharacterized protein n=1 Tax=Penicillium angulare TaxID=116970 RepID=UPI002540D078|nr:uncharacterized protein N7478_013377 [Penicillium angulare]KAJ5257273.1 hypothetical protein N7478_013377 [Penicillium angulare]